MHIVRVLFEKGKKFSQVKTIKKKKNTDYTKLAKTHILFSIWKKKPKTLDQIRNFRCADGMNIYMHYIFILDTVQVKKNV